MLTISLVKLDQKENQRDILGLDMRQQPPELERKFNLNELIEKEIKNPLNGSADIYWIDAKILETIKSSNVKNRL